jgi:predicted ATPase
MSSSPAARVRARRQLLAELAARGYATGEESERAIIAERLARVASPRPDACAKTFESTSISLALPSGSSFDRGLVDALGMLHEASPKPSIELETNRRKIVSCRAAMLRN